jgi:hypothetical protein
METMPKLDREAYKAAMRRKVEEALDAIVDSVDGATPGRIIRESEEKVRDIFADLRQDAYERVLQMKVDAAEAVFSPSAQYDHGQAEAE